MQRSLEIVKHLILRLNSLQLIFFFTVSRDFPLKASHFSHLYPNTLFLNLFLNFLINFLNYLQTNQEQLKNSHLGFSLFFPRLYADKLSRSHLYIEISHNQQLASYH